MLYQITDKLYQQGNIAEPETIKNLILTAQSTGNDRFIWGAVNLIQDTYCPNSPTTREVITFIGTGSMACACLDPDESKLLLRGKAKHRHNFYELMYVAEGTVYQNIENSRHRYPAGSLCLMNMNIRHLEEYDESCRVIFLQFTRDYIWKILDFRGLFEEEQTPVHTAMKSFFLHELKSAEASHRSYIDFIPLTSSQKVHDFLDEIACCMQCQSLSSDFRIAAALTDMFGTIFDHQFYTTTPVDLGNAAERELFENVTAYIRQHHGQVRRKDLEQHFSYSGDYLYKIVAKYTGLSLYEYSVQFTLEEARTLLEETDCTVTEIMDRLGFGNRTQFYRLFQNAYGVTPGKYRKIREA